MFHACSFAVESNDAKFENTEAKGYKKVRGLRCMYCTMRIFRKANSTLQIIKCPTHHLMIDNFPVFDEALRISVLYAAVQSFGHPFLSGFVSHIQRFVHGDIGEYALSVFIIV